jgi:hypothetical protein
MKKPEVVVSCLSVVGGWVTLVEKPGELRREVGPTYHRITDLWAWQRKNREALYSCDFDSLTKE